MSAVLIVFARTPEHAKSRLAAAYGRARATRIATALLADALARGERSGLARRQLYWDGALDHPAVAAARRRGWETAVQEGADLGARMAAAFATVLHDDAGAVLAGTDCPDLRGDVIAAAASRLDAADVVLVPAADGGYVLIGLRRSAQPHLPTLFSGIVWGGDDVAATTRTRIAGCGLTLAELRPLPDVDDADDLQRLGALHPWLLDRAASWGNPSP